MAGYKEISFSYLQPMLFDIANDVSSMFGIMKSCSDF